MIDALLEQGAYAADVLRGRGLVRSAAVVQQLVERIDAQDRELRAHRKRQAVCTICHPELSGCVGMGVGALRPGPAVPAALLEIPKGGEE